MADADAVVRGSDGAVGDTAPADAEAAPAPNAERLVAPLLAAPLPATVIGPAPGVSARLVVDVTTPAAAPTPKMLSPAAAAAGADEDLLGGMDMEQISDEELEEESKTGAEFFAYIHFHLSYFNYYIFKMRNLDFSSGRCLGRGLG